MIMENIIYIDGIAEEYSGRLNDYDGMNIHREDGPAIIYSIGRKEWWLNGRRHRVGGPAIERSTRSKEWHLNGKRHRVDGPAVEWANGVTEWWLNGREYIFKDFLMQLPEEEAILVALEWK